MLSRKARGVRPTATISSRIDAGLFYVLCKRRRTAQAGDVEDVEDVEGGVLFSSHHKDIFFY